MAARITEGEPALSQPPRSSFVTVVAWLSLVISGLATPVAVLQNIMVFTVYKDHPLASQGSEIAHLSALNRFLLEHANLVIHAFLVVCLWTFVCSIGLLKRREWARKGFIALLTAALAYQVVGFLPQLFQGGASGGGPGFEGFRAFVLMVRLVSVGVALALVAVLAWMIRRLRSAPVREEFARASSFSRM